MVTDGRHAADTRLPPVGPVRQASRLRIGLALGIVYLVWGSTYLAIRVTVAPTHGAAMPPLLMAGSRYLVAGGALFAATAHRAAPDGLPDPLGRRQWAATTVVGISLLVGGNGFVVLAERRIASGVTAVVVATVPIWTALIAAVRGYERVSARHLAGLALGFVGVGALVVGHGGRYDPVGVGLVVIAALLWSAGSVYSQRAPMPRRPLVMTAMEMLAGGAVLTAVAVAVGEPARLHPSQLGASVWVAWAYLVIAGSIVAFTYVWVLRNAPLSLATTYAYVNPVVAIGLGSLVLSEPLSGRAIAATLVTLAGVVLLVTRRSPVAAGEQRD